MRGKGTLELAAEGEQIVDGIEEGQEDFEKEIEERESQEEADKNLADEKSRISQQIKQQRNKRKSKVGRASTIATSPLGLIGTENSPRRRKTLLGL